MRPIKFRAWDREKKKMTYFESIKDILFGFDDGVSHVRDLPSVFEWDKRLVWSQYTGLDDINGTPIFEGDIVEENGINRVVEYGYCEVDNEGSTGDYAYGFNLYHDNRGVKVIGNIYENPELLN